jgi:hypothetical protein
MPRGIVFRSSRNLQRKHLRRGEIAHAMLVMDGERLVGLARRGRRARGHVQQPPPAGRRIVELTRATQQGGLHPQSVDS